MARMPAHETSQSARKPRVLSGMQPTADSLHLGNYLGALRQWVAPAGRPRRLLLRRRPARDHRRARPRRRCASAPGSTAAQYLAGGRRPRALDALRAEPRARARPAGVGAAVHHRLRRGQPDDAVQGQVGARAPTRASVGLFTYPVLQAADILLYRRRPGAGRRGPAPAPRADPRPGPAVQQPLRRRRSSCPSRTSSRRPRRSSTCRTPTARCPSQRSAGAGVVDLLDDPKVIAKKIRSAVTDTGREVRFDPRRQAGRLQPADASTRALTGRPVADARGATTPAAATATSRRTLAEVVVDVRRRRSATARCELPRRPGRARPDPRRRRASGPARSPRATLARRLRPGRLPAAPAARVDRSAARDRSASRSRSRSRTATELQDCAGALRRPAGRRRSRRTSPCCRRPRSTQRRSPRSTSHLRGGRRGGRAVPRSPCAAPARSGRSRRSSSSQVAGGHRRVRAARARGPRRPAAPRPGLPLPPARHRRPRPRRRRAGPGLRGPRRLRRAPSRCAAFHLYEHGADGSGAPCDAFALRGRPEHEDARAPMSLLDSGKRPARAPAGAPGRGGPGRATATPAATSSPAASATSRSSPSSRPSRWPSPSSASSCRTAPTCSRPSPTPSAVPPGLRQGRRATRTASSPSRRRAPAR